MRILLDAMGEKGVTEAVVKAAVLAKKKLSADMVLVGDKDILEKELSRYKMTDRISVENAPSVILNTDDSVLSVKNKKDASMVVAAKMLSLGQGDVLISSGSTGALLSAAMLIVGRIRGIKRPAIATLLPTQKGTTMLLDSGANTNLKAENLLEFAIMGSTYMKYCMGIENPKVSLISNGEEDEKGNELTKKANALLKTAPINFVGNIEGRDIFSGKADVIVADGFTGNIIIKTIEGVAGFVKISLKDVFGGNFIRRLFLPIYYGALKKAMQKMDFREYGGSMFLGIKKPVYKCHGSSDWKAVYKTIEKVLAIGDNDVSEITEKLLNIDSAQYM